MGIERLVLVLHCSQYSLQERVNLIRRNGGVFDNAFPIKGFGNGRDGGAGDTIYHSEPLADGPWVCKFLSLSTQGREIGDGFILSPRILASLKSLIMRLF